jgi:carbonic anhydrase
MSRRRLIETAAALPFATGLAVTPSGSFASTDWTPPPPTDLTPDQALDVLKQGNAAFQADAPLHPSIDGRRRGEIAQAQSPIAAILSCADSRVPPELLFGRGLGELFVVRNAGNVADVAAVGSLEFAVAVLGAPLIVVMGHERCGAVAAALTVIDQAQEYPGSIGTMLEPILPAAVGTRNEPGSPLVNVTRAHVLRTVTRLRGVASSLLIPPQNENRLKIVGAVYDLDTGAVEFLEAT